MNWKEGYDMFLDMLDRYDKITIQCHDNPDADTIGAGFGVYRYLMSKGKRAELIYGGKNIITKPSLVMMIRELQIPIQHVDQRDKCEFLLTVDCQYQGGNVTPFPAEHIGMIDHHPVCVPIDDRCWIKDQYGSCSTAVWELMCEAGYDFEQDMALSTALYYGLYSDTGQLSEIYMKQDRQMRDQLIVDRRIMDRIVNSNLTREELKIAGEALSSYYFDEDYSFAILRTRPCDPNLLGVISDMAIQVDTVDLCVVYNETAIGYKLSIRSNLNEASASQLARYISRDAGTGGGHNNKAGVYLMKKYWWAKHSDTEFEQTLIRQIRDFKDKGGLFE